MVCIMLTISVETKKMVRTVLNVCVAAQRPDGRYDIRWHEPECCVTNHSHAAVAKWVTLETGLRRGND